MAMTSAKPSKTPRPRRAASCIPTSVSTAIIRPPAARGESLAATPLPMTETGSELVRYPGAVRDRLALVADVVFLLLAGVAAFIGIAGGVRWHIGGLRMTAVSGTRAAATAIIVLAARHAVVRHPSFAARLLIPLRHVKRLVRSRRLAAAADVVTVSLAALAFIIDLAGGVEWQAGALELSMPDGSRPALAAVAVWLLRRVT